MATRFAGDFFGVGLDESAYADSSELMKAFPELRSLGAAPSKKTSLEDFFKNKTYESPQLTGGGFAPKPFAGFKVSGY